MDHPVIVDTLTGEIADDGRYSPADRGRRPAWRVTEACNEMNQRAEALGIRTRYELAKACPHCAGSGIAGGPPSKASEQCGFCENGVTR